MKYFFKYHFPFLFWLTVIFIQSRLPAEKFIPPVFFSVDKLTHILVFGMLAVLCYISLVHLKTQNFLSDRPFLWTFIICCVWGAFDEFNQSFVKNRSSDFADWIADVIGIILSIVLIRYYLSKRFNLFQNTSINTSQS